MRPIYTNTVIQIEITNACHLKCANCTRFVGHHRKPFYMTLDEVRNAIDSLHGFPGRVGIMGGEPCLHPQFREILAVLREMVPDKPKREFWTAGFKWGDYEADIRETFLPERIAFNDHTQTTGKHQPLLVAIDEIVDDPVLRAELIDKCWVQAQWSASITPLGAYFCEIAAARGALHGIRGWPVERGWWDKRPAEFSDQVHQFCGGCSAALPLPAYSDGRGGRDGATVDVASPLVLERLVAAGSPKAKRGHVEIWDKKLTRDEIEGRKDWHPSHFRPFEAHGPEDVKKALAPTG